MTATGLYDHGYKIYLITMCTTHDMVINRSTALIYILTTGRVHGYPVGYPGNELLDNGSPKYWYNENELPLPLLSLETFLSWQHVIYSSMR